jgi:hypothetical protein
MPNDALVDRVLALQIGATASERLVLKIAASLIKQLDAENYSVFEDDDPRIKLTREEWDWVPGRFEIFNGIVSPKDWETPERLAAAAREDQEGGDEPGA